MLILFLFVYVGCLLFYQPQKASLRDTNTYSLFQKIRTGKATLILGCLLILIALFSFQPNLQIAPAMAAIFGMSWPGVFTYHLYFQPMSSLFFHFDWVHLIGNLSVLLLLSAYERRVGALRFIFVFLVSGILASLFFLLIMPHEALALGASGGLCGLVAAYFLDDPGIAKKEWMYGGLAVLGFILFMSLLPDHRTEALHYSVNWSVHLLGAFIALFLIKLCPLKAKRPGNPAFQPGQP